MKKTVKVIAGVTAFALIGIILFLANSLLGNPVSKHIAESKAEKYIAETYPALELRLEKAKYDFKLGGYSINVTSPTSIDTQFVLEYSNFGNLKNDSYKWSVGEKFNTLLRVNRQYIDEVEKVISSKDFPLKGVCYFYSGIDSQDANNFELDKKYDLYELGKKEGYITLCVKSDIVDSKMATDAILKLKDFLDKNAVAFYKLNFTLCNKPNNTYPKPDDYEEFDVMDLLYTEIYEENFEKRLIKAEEATKKKLAVLDAQKQAEIDAYESAIKEQADK